MIKLPRKPTELVLTLGLGILSFYLAFLGKDVTNFEGILLIVAGLIQLYLFKQVATNKVILYGWSLISFAWTIPSFYSLWIFSR